MSNHSEETNNGIDAVQMTRRIRDERYERVKDMTLEERLKYYRDESAAAHQRFIERIREADKEFSRMARPSQRAQPAPWRASSHFTLSQRHMVNRSTLTFLSVWIKPTTPNINKW